MLKLCGETEEKLAQELLQFEVQIERDVVEPLYVLAEVSETQFLTFFHTLNDNGLFFQKLFFWRMLNLCYRLTSPISKSRENTWPNLS